MEKEKYRRYGPEFKRHALKQESEDSVMDKEGLGNRACH